MSSFTFIGCVNWQDHLESNTATASKAGGVHTLQRSSSVSNIFLRETHTSGKRDRSDVSSSKNCTSIRKEINELWYLHIR